MAGSPLVTHGVAGSRGVELDDLSGFIARVGDRLVKYRLGVPK